MLFDEEACFSKRVPKEAVKMWLTHGGRIHSGGIGSVASYFFAVDIDDEWTSALCRRSVVVIHAGWILHCVAHSFRIPIAGYILDDGFKARPPFSRLQGTFPSISPRPYIRQSQPSTPFYPPSNVLNLKRKRQRPSYDYPGALHSEPEGSLHRRPRKRRIVYFSPSEESLSSTSEAYNPSAIKHEHSDAIICHTNKHSPSIPYSLSPPPLGPTLQVSNTLQNNQGKAVALNCVYERAPAYPLVVGDTGPGACLEDSPPVPDIDFTRLHFPSRNRWRFPLLLEPVAVTTVAEGEKNDGDSTRPTSLTRSSVPVGTQTVHPVPQLSMIPLASNSPNKEDKETGLPLEVRARRVEPCSSLRHSAPVTDSRSDIAIYDMDQLLRMRKCTPGCDEVLLSTLWENNAIWKKKRFWYKTLGTKEIQFG